jgi:hypothetical protein
MRLVCHQNVSHKRFLRESYDAQGNKVNVEVVEETGLICIKGMSIIALNVSKEDHQLRKLMTSERLDWYKDLNI